MKPFWIALSILAALFFCVQANVSYLGRFVHALQDEVTLSAEAVEQEDWDSAMEHAKAAYDTWHAKSIYLHVTLKHADIDKIYVLLEDTVAHLETQDTEEFVAASRTLLRQLDLLYDMERLSPQNIL